MNFLPAFKRPLGLLLLLLFSAGPAMANDQQTMSLETFMSQVQQQYGIYFSYQADSLRATTVVYGAVSRQKEPNPDRLLSNVLTPAGLSIQKVNNVYIIAPAVTFDTADDQSPGRNSWRRSRRQLVE